MAHSFFFILCEAETIQDPRYWRRGREIIEVQPSVSMWEHGRSGHGQPETAFLSISEGAPIIKGCDRKALVFTWERMPKGTGKLVCSCAWRGASWEVWLNGASWRKAAEKQRAQQGPSRSFSVSLLSGTAPAQGRSWVTSPFLVFSQTTCNK